VAKRSQQWAARLDAVTEREAEAGDEQKRTLAVLLSINAAMFVVELAAGWVAESMGLIADSLDMLADALVYGAAWLAVGSTARRQTRAATASGVIQLVLGAGVALEVARRAYEGSQPVSLLMIAVSTVALCANTVCLVLLRKHKDAGIHMRASWIFTASDVQANVGVIVAGILVRLTGSAWPDLLIGLAVCGLVVQGGVRILREAGPSLRPGSAPG
jgi:cation diffusion facilitator family transporter